MVTCSKKKNDPPAGIEPTALPTPTELRVNHVVSRGRAWGGLPGLRISREYTWTLTGILLPVHPYSCFGKGWSQRREKRTQESLRA